MSYADKAQELFMNGYNCAQAVFAAYSDKTGIDEKTSLAIAASFGGGFGRMREVCGAVSGALMVYGTLYGTADGGDFLEKARHYQHTQHFMKDFKAECGSYICRELLGEEGGDNAPTPAARTNEYYKKRPCVEYVRFACDLLDSYIAQRG